MKKIAIVIVLVLMLIFFLKPYFRKIPDECSNLFEVNNKLLSEIKSSPYASADFVKRYKNKNDEFISLFKKAMKRESDNEKTRRVCKGLNDLWLDRLERLKQIKNEKEFRLLL